MTETTTGPLTTPKPRTLVTDYLGDPEFAVMPYTRKLTTLLKALDTDYEVQTMDDEGQREVINYVLSQTARGVGAPIEEVRGQMQLQQPLENEDVQRAVQAETRRTVAGPGAYAPDLHPDALQGAPSPFQALAQAFQGQQRVPLQSPAPPPEPSADPATMLDEAVGATPAGRVVSAIAGADSPGPLMGELAGMGASLLVPGGPAVRTAARMVLPALGAGGGLSAERLVTQGELPTAEDVTKEVMLSFAPELAQEVLSGAGRLVGRATRGGQDLRLDEAARRAAGVGPSIFEAPERQAVSTLFEQVRQSGVKLHTDYFQSFLQGLPRDQVEAILTRDIRAIDRDARNGGKFEDLMRRMWGTPQKPPGVVPADIGDLQDLRSALRQRVERLRDPAARDVLLDMRDAVDATIDNALTIGGASAGDVPDVLKKAREQWTRVRAAEDLGTLLTTSPVTRSTNNATMRRFSLDNLDTALRNNRSRLAQSTNRSLDYVPGARERFMLFLDELRQVLPSGGVTLTNFPTPHTSLSPFTAMDRMLSYVLTSETGQRLFREAVVEGRGRLSVNALATMVNTLRREYEQPPSTPAPAEATAPDRTAGTVPTGP